MMNNTVHCYRFDFKSQVKTKTHNTVHCDTLAYGIQRFLMPEQILSLEPTVWFEKLLG